MSRRLTRILAAVCLFTLLSAASAMAEEVSKVLLDDGTVAELTNSGTRNAVSRLVESTRVPSAAKADAIDAILVGAWNAGNLSPSPAVEGDVVLALDSSGVPTTYVVTSSLIVGPPTGIIGWWHPGGIH